jgi:hypothetical protein
MASLLDNRHNLANAFARQDRDGLPDAAAEEAERPQGGPGRGGGLRIWLPQVAGVEQAERLEVPLRQWLRQGDRPGRLLTVLHPGADLGAEARSAPPDVVVLDGGTALGGLGPDGWLALGAGLVVAVEAGRAEPWLLAAERQPLQLVPAGPGADTLGWAILSVAAAIRRERTWQVRVDALQQRLADRIVIERAKGVLVRQLGISEEEAYKRLRVLSRRQRRQIRDIAQSLLDAQSLLAPGGEDLASGLGPEP